jgi:hypothetical protein
VRPKKALQNIRRLGAAQGKKAKESGTFSSSRENRAYINEIGGVSKLFRRRAGRGAHSGRRLS